MPKFNNKRPVLHYYQYESPTPTGIDITTYLYYTNKFIEDLEWNLNITEVPPNAMERLRQQELYERTSLLLERNQAIAKAKTSDEARIILIQYNKKYQEKFKIVIPVNPPPGYVFTDLASLEQRAFNVYVEHTSLSDIQSAVFPEKMKNAAVNYKNGIFNSYPTNMDKIFQAQNDQPNKRKRIDDDEDAAADLDPDPTPDSNSPRIKETYVPYTPNPS